LQFKGVGFLLRFQATQSEKNFSVCWLTLNKKFLPFIKLQTAKVNRNRFYPLQINAIYFFTCKGKFLTGRKVR